LHSKRAKTPFLLGDAARMLDLPHNLIFKENSHMAGLMADTPNPTSITVHTQSQVLEISFADGANFRLPFELMRVYSPSAEVQGHGPGQEVLQTGKHDVGILELESVGNYAIQPRFSDGHESGIFSWDYLYFLGSQQAALWADYEARLQAAGRDRHAPMPLASSGGACASHGHSH
jgi:DUF971 family protein